MNDQRHCNASKLDSVSLSAAVTSCLCILFQVTFFADWTAGANSMALLSETWTYFLQDQERFLRLLGQHLILSVAALAIAVVVCLPLGIIIAHRGRIAQPVINFFNTLRVLPSLVILFLALPYLGLGFLPSLVASDDSGLPASARQHLRRHP